ncbi:EAL and modified HD-GYP domain-containing signal transduction protein [Motilibacter rhizosphaerae]|uniref:EAL and modified HD-GYP domain-containing signal transduction protein n=1 Tax=Motilibacter rhizosphaerae TaxID=598652 RepID=A0A4Q7NBA9_9ACTN|nr:HDOD domain-containing protein [Motilibacter rhizosphaerae]RZS80110.1 EAL and modified HD-GYP domain-containing signal transduction protein [Motilibacter rhizosphaerae]
MPGTAHGLTTTTSVTPVHVGRQPIYDADGDLHAYELLFRSAAGASSASVADEDAATTAVMLAAFADFSPSVLLSGRRGFVNLSRSFATGALPVPFSPSDGVLEVLENLAVDDELLAGVRGLRDQGYAIALDDYVLTDETATLLPFADYVKLDVLATPWDEVVRVAGVVQSYGAVLLAEKVEDAEMLERCRGLGFQLFQGYHLGRPQTMTTTTLAPAQLAAVRLLGALADEDVAIPEVELLVMQEPALTYKLLRMANSAGSSSTRTIQSVRDALMLVGLAQLRAWVMLLTVSDIAGDRGDGLDSVTALARSCQVLAQRVPRAQPDTAFTLGLLEGVAGLLGVDGAALLDQIGLTGSLADGLRGLDTPERRVLDAVLGHQRNDLEIAAASGIDIATLSSTYLSALQWSFDTRQKAGV